MLYSIYGMKAQNDNIGHTAHFGGAVGGYVITLVKEPQLLVEHTLMVILLAIPIVLLFVLVLEKDCFSAISDSRDGERNTQQQHQLL